MKQCIVFDLDGTLRYYDHIKRTNTFLCCLRPKLGNFLTALETLKSKIPDFDFIIYTYDTSSNIENFLKKIGSHKNIFDKIISIDNAPKPLENSVEQSVYKGCLGKPITLLGDYDRIFFIDDSPLEKENLINLHNHNGMTKTEIIFFNVPSYSPKIANKMDIYGTERCPNNNVRKALDSYITELLEDPCLPFVFEKISEILNTSDKVPTPNNLKIIDFPQSITDYYSQLEFSRKNLNKIFLDCYERQI